MLGPAVKVLSVERVESTALWHRYTMAKATQEPASQLIAAGNEHETLIEALLLDDLRNEKCLWHGCMSEEAASMICEKGFDLSLARSGTFGAGCYFSSDPTTPLLRAGAVASVGQRRTLLLVR